MSWTELHLQVTTPLFNAGADPAATYPGVRVSSLRGAMRFWLRTLIGGVTGPNLALLAELENTVFGSTEKSCPVALRIPNPPQQCAAGSEEMDRWVVYLLGQGLGDLRTRTTIRSYVQPDDDTFTVKLRLDKADKNVAALTLAALWLLSAYGGIGARTRRGFGGVRIIGSDGWLPSPWDPESILSPHLDHYEGRTSLWPDEALNACVASLLGEKAPNSGKAWTVRPTFPVLHQEHTTAGTSQAVFTGWDHVLRHAGEQWRNFRASQDYPGARYTPARKTPEWNGVVSGPGNRFPLGALGLPVVFKKNGPVVNAEHNDESLRRASPLWLRAVGSSKKWRLFSFAFLGEFLPGPDAPVVNLRNGRRPPKTLQVRTDDIDRLALQWITAMAEGKSFVQLRRH